MFHFIFAFFFFTGRHGFATTSKKEFIFAGHDLPRFTWKEGQKVTGGVTEIMEEICNQLKVKCKIEVAPLARCLKMLEDGEIADALNMAPNPERIVFSTPSKPLAQFSIAYAANKLSQKPKISNLQDLSGWNVVGVRGSTSLKMAEKLQSLVKGMTLSVEVSSLDLIQFLKNQPMHSKNVAVGVEESLQYYAEKKLDMEFVYSTGAQPFTVAFSNKKMGPEDQAAFNDAIAALTKKGTLKKILSKFHLKPF